MRTSPKRVSGSAPIGDLVAGDLAAESRCFQQGQAAGPPAADVDGTPSQRVGLEQLLLDQVDEVLDVEQVAHLLAAPPVADVASASRPK